MNPLQAGMMGLISEDEAINMESLRFAVQRQIMDRTSGVVLDERTAKYLRVEAPDGQAALEVFEPTTWKAMSVAILQLPSGYKTEVIDGATLPWSKVS